MFKYFALLLFCQLIGEVLVRLTGLPIPAPVWGMILLFIGLVIHGRIPSDLEDVARALLGHLSFLFIPAGVGVILYLDLIGAQWLPIIAALIGGTIITIGVTALVMQGVSRRGHHHDKGNTPS